MTGNNIPKRRNTLMTIHGLITQNSGNEAIILILSHINPLPHTTSLKTTLLHVVITAQSRPRSCNWSIFRMFPHQNMYAILFLPTCVTSPVHHILLDLLARIIFGEESTPLPRGHRLIVGTFSAGRGGLSVPMKLGATLVGPIKPDRLQRRSQTKCVPQR